MTTPMKIEYGFTLAFQKDIKRLLKKFRTLEEDLEVVKLNAIELYHLKKIDNRSVFSIPDYCNKKIQIYKIKKFSCKSLKGRGVRSGIRVIYAFYPEFFKVDFIQIYFKGEKENADFDRIREYLKNFS